MRGIDTNVLVRFFTADDAAQYGAARAFLESCEAAGEEVFVTTVCLCELLWTLAGSRYRVGRAEQARVVEELLAAAAFVIESHDVVRLALQDFGEGAGDFADYLIGRLSTRAGAADTVTFDRALEGDKGFTLLGWDAEPPGSPVGSSVHEP